MKTEITFEDVKRLFDYKNGFLYRKIKVNRNTVIGSKVGTMAFVNGCYRRYISFDYKGYTAARLIFLWHHGYLPVQVDHIDRDSLNDKIENLREANSSQNNANRNALKNKTSKYLGVHFSTENITLFSIKKKDFITHTYHYWCASLSSNGKEIRIGRFKNEIQAALAYNREAVRHHKEFANLNIITL